MTRDKQTNSEWGGTKNPSNSVWGGTNEQIVSERERRKVWALVYRYYCFTDIIVHRYCFCLQILLVNKQDGSGEYTYLSVVLPLFISLATLIIMSFGAKGGNQCKSKEHLYSCFLCSPPNPFPLNKICFQLSAGYWLWSRETQNIHPLD